MAQFAVNPGRNVAVVVALAGAAIWLLTHEYTGLSGDGALYTMMALNRSMHGAFNSDLFLRYGSQDAYSIFSPIYGWLIGLLGILRANVGLLLAAHVLWLAGAWMLTHRLARGIAGHAAFLLVCALPLTYGGWSFLTAGEPYLTSRPFAEGLVLIGLARLLSRSWPTAALAFVLAAAFHPIMSLAGLGAAYITLAIRRPWLFAAAPLGLAVGLGLAIAHIEPFDRALTIMDGTWFGAVRLRNPFVLLATWSWVDWTRVLCDLAPCAVAAAVTRGSRRGFFAGVAVTGAVALLVTLIGGDSLRDALIVQLQLGRCGWLPAVVQLPALVVIFLRLRRAPMGRLAAALLAAPSLLLVLEFETVAWPAAALSSLIGVAVAMMSKAGRLPRLEPKQEVRWLIAVAVLPVGNILAQTILMWRLAAFTARLHLALPGEPSFLPVRLALLAGAGALAVLARRRLAPALAAIAVTFIVGAATWDERTPWERFVTSGQILPLASILPPGAALLWGVDAADSWFLLRHPAYVSKTQSAGLLFSRATALTWLARRDNVASVIPIGVWTSERKAPPCAGALAPLPAQEVAAACTKSPGLYGVIVDRPVVGGAAFSTQAAKETVCAAGTGFGVTRVDRFYYVACPKTR